MEFVVGRRETAKKKSGREALSYVFLVLYGMFGLETMVFSSFSNFLLSAVIII